MFLLDDVRHGMCFSDDECQGISPSRCGVSRHLHSEHCAARHIYRRMPPHILPDRACPGTCCSQYWPCVCVLDKDGHRSSLPGDDCQSVAFSFCRPVSSMWHPDDACHGLCFSEDECQRVFLPDDARQSILPSKRRVSGHISSRRRVSSHVAFGRHMPRHVLSGRRVPGFMPSGRRMSRHISCRRPVSGHFPSGHGAARYIYRRVPPHILPDCACQCTCCSQCVPAVRMRTRRRWAPQ